MSNKAASFPFAIARHCLNSKLRRMASAACTSVGRADDWDRPFTDEELQAIDAAFLSAGSTTTATSTWTSSSSPIKERQLCAAVSDDSHSKTRRRLPESLFIFHPRNANSFSLSPCHRKRFYSSYRSSFSSSSRGNLKMKYQEMAFKGRIVYSRTLDEVEKSAEELQNFVEAKKEKEGQVVLGFDIEWKPSFRRGVPPGKAAVMQICRDNSLCYVFHICHTGIPQNLQHLLHNPTSVKVGISIASDATKIDQDHNVSVRALEDLSDLANLKLGDCKKWSLSALTEMLICKQLPKPNKIRLGNWEADILSKEQVQYAASDAFVSWYLYQVLKTLPEAANNKSEELGPVAAE